MTGTSSSSQDSNGPVPVSDEGRWVAVRFIGEPISVEFDYPPPLEKEPACPSRFVWREQVYRVVQRLSEWRDYGRRGRMARNMSARHLEAASRRGSWGVGRFFFRVVTDDGLVFELYYDRRPKGPLARKGQWFLFRELRQQPPVAP